jgi:hypothetical protein
MVNYTMKLIYGIIQNCLTYTFSDVPPCSSKLIRGLLLDLRGRWVFELRKYPPQTQPLERGSIILPKQLKQIAE